MIALGGLKIIKTMVNPMQYLLIFINSQPGSGDLRGNSFLNPEQGDHLNQGECGITGQETDQKGDRVFRGKKEENDQEQDVDEYFHAHGPEIPCRKFPVIPFTRPEQVYVHEQGNGKEENGDQGEKKKVPAGEQEEEDPVPGCRQHKGQQDKVKNVFSE
jgi:hypothetical protein